VSDRLTVILYEDEYHAELHRLIKRIRTRDLGRGSAIIEPATARGDGGFVRELPLLLRTMQRATRRPPDRVVCVADADRPANLYPEMSPAPIGATPEQLRAWLASLESSWRDALLLRAGVSAEDAPRVSVACLLWNKESLLIACPDALEDFAGEDRAAVTTHLATCQPPLGAVTDEAFSTTYRNPARCLDAVLQVAQQRRYKKGRDDEDLLRDHIARVDARRQKLLARSPDLIRLIDLIDAPP
jgi:hypothetical protein